MALFLVGWPAFDQNGARIHNGQISRSVMSFHLFKLSWYRLQKWVFLHFQARCMKKKPTASDFPKKFKTLERFEFPAVLPSDRQQETLFRQINIGSFQTLWRLVGKKDTHFYSSGKKLDMGSHDLKNSGRHRFRKRCTKNL